jgi:hypothetical protein
MELVWQPAQPALEPVQALLESRAAKLRAGGISAPVLLGIEEGDPYACLDVVTDASTYRVIVLAGAAGSGRTDYDALLFNLADASTPLLDRTPGPAELEVVLDELIAAIPISEAFRTQSAIAARLNGPGGNELLGQILAATADNDDPALVKARAALAQAETRDGMTASAASARPGHFARLGSVLAAGLSFGLGLAILALVSPLINAGPFVVIFALASALALFLVLEPPARSVVAMVRLGWAVRQKAEAVSQAEPNSTPPKGEA